MGRASGRTCARGDGRLPVKPMFVEVEAMRQTRGREARLGALIARNPVDVCFAGIGENGHLAFNDPPADFDTEAPTSW